MDGGIYQIRNIVTDDIYIGHSKNLKKRKQEHFGMMKRGNHHNINVKESVSNFGIQNFLFEILLYCDEQNLIFYEQLLVDKLKPSFNILVDDVMTYSGVRHSKETKLKMSFSSSGSLNHNYGKNLGTRQFSQETKEKMSVSRKKYFDSIGKKTKKEKSKNYKKSKTSSKYIGVYLNNGRWVARIMHDNKTIYLGGFFLEDDAANSYNIAALKYFGENARLNIIE